MLAHLRVENLALIEELDLELAPGLNVLSGETGAGKSVLVDSLALLVGERADPADIRTGADGALVEGLFRLEAPALRRRVAELTGEETRELALRREIFRDQRNRCYVAGRLAPAALLRSLGEMLVELHGQHEHQLLLQRSVQRDLLDAFGGLEDRRRELARAHRAGQEAARRLAEIRERDRTRRERQRVLHEEAAEIRAAGIDLALEAELRAEAERLRHVEDRLALAARLVDTLCEGEPAALELLRGARGDLEALARDEPRFGPGHENLGRAVEDLQDLARELQRYLDGLGRDPERLAVLDRREELLLRLTRRYATDLAGLVARAAAAREELAHLEAEAGEEAGLDARVAAAEREIGELAAGLTRGRRRAAAALARAVEGNLRDLGIGRGRLEVAFETVDLEAGGLERVEFLIAPNPGEAPAPLRAVASGGELSRLILALKAALAAVDRVPTLVFDEVDAGIGGRLAHRVAAKLLEIARTRQVLAVTHLAPIAAPAGHHLRVEKAVRGKRVRITVQPLAGEERIEELSRMLGGAPESETSRRYARELLGAARKGG